MTKLVWDQIGERIYQTGVDRGVLYLQDGTVAVWNGLTGVEETGTFEIKSFHLDGVKYLETVLPGDFSGKLTAFTYPDEFDSVNGIIDPHSVPGLSNPDDIPGLSYHDQPVKSFNLSYRTLIGNDLEGTELGYKIHILYNIFAIADSESYGSLNDSGVQPVEFSWTLSGTPTKIQFFRPTAHISIDSRKTPPDILELLENILYGTPLSDPHLPTMQEVAAIFGYLGFLLIYDNGDGTWVAYDQFDNYISMIDDTTFQIDGANAVYLDLTTYNISSTYDE